MCRVLTYLGKSINLYELLYKPDNAFIKQSYDPLYMYNILNLAGFGLAAWEKKSYLPEWPYIYKTLQLPFYDKNLLNFSRKSCPECFLAHLRGLDYSYEQIISLENLHPFVFKNTNISFAHNGDLYDFDKMKYDLIEYIHPTYKTNILGSTDSEWIYAIFMSQLLLKNDGDESINIYQSIIETIQILYKIRHKHNIKVHSPLNLFITNGSFIAAIRYVMDFGMKANAYDLVDIEEYHSLWYTHGDTYGIFNTFYRMKNTDLKNSIIIASEPLTADTSTWIQLPESSFIFAQKIHNKINISTLKLDL